MVGIKGLWMEKNYTIETEIKFSFIAQWNALFYHFRQNLHKGPKRAFSTQQNLAVSVIHPVWSCSECPFQPFAEWSPDTVEFVFKFVEFVFKALAYKDVMSFELCTRIAPDLKSPFQSFV